MWQKPLLLGDKNRNIDAVYPKQARFTPVSYEEINLPLGEFKLHVSCNKDSFLF